MKTPVRVTRDHIDNCDMTSQHHCVMARALRDALPLASYVQVGIAEGALVHVADPKEELVPIYMPREVQCFISWLGQQVPQEERHLVPERTFQIEIPDQFLAQEQTTEEPPDPTPEPTPPPQSSLRERILTRVGLL